MENETKHSGGKQVVWQSDWRSPVSLGIFFITTALAVAILLYALLSVVGSVLSAMHPADAGQGISQQELQQMVQQQSSASGGSAAPTTGQ